MVGSKAASAAAAAAGADVEAALMREAKPMLQLEVEGRAKEDDVDVADEAAFAVVEPPVDEDAAAERQAEVGRLLSGFRRHLDDRRAHHLGYPYNLDLDELAQQLSPFFQGLCINNLGDPFIESNYGVHSRPMEVAVLDW
ncbi:hypothetical protein HU200_067432 [Digitaria exilis]|uniref:Uncharacterized protein n=1 Tax=Digitaria exilis TaxID=1010633 RepID=A0A835DW92_9POAL|nr:hypothetical protein HU200_067432 [Digitaria exilis]